jgi:hypothetical protein
MYLCWFLFEGFPCPVPTHVKPIKGVHFYHSDLKIEGQHDHASTVHSPLQSRHCITSGLCNAGKGGGWGGTKCYFTFRSKTAHQALKTKKQQGLPKSWR